jgi:hypothetical protein
MPVSRVPLLAERALPDLLDPLAGPADRAAAARLVDRAQSTSLTSLPLHRAAAEAVLRFLEPAPGARLVRFLTAAEAAPPALPTRRVARLLARAPGLEPLPRGPQVLEQVAVRATVPRRRRARQGHLGDCWLIAVLDACETVSPGFLDRLVSPVPVEDNSPAGTSHAGRAAAAGGPREPHDVHLVAIDLTLPRAAVPGLRRIPFLPVRRTTIAVSTRVPVRHRAGDTRLRASVASLVEKAAVVAWADGSYRRLQNDFAGIGLLLATGRWSPARPVPRTVEAVGGWLEEGRPVVLSTLKRPGGSFELDRGDGEGTIAFMDAHVYVARRVLHCDETGRAGTEHPLRLHVHNPVGGSDSRRRRRTDLYLSAQQMRRAFISANVGPALQGS